MNNIKELPKLKRSYLTERITLAITPEMKSELATLKHKDNIDTTALIRNLITDFLRSRAS